MRCVFVYEYITGGGLWRESPDEAPAGSLLCEGAAMVQAVVADFVAADLQFEVVALRDRRVAQLDLPGCRMIEIGSAEEELAAVRELAAAADASLLIAPEMGGALTQRCREVERAGGSLLGPDSSFVETAADKLSTTTRLQDAGIPVPFATALTAGSPLPSGFPFPAVLKPRDGAGSLGVARIDRADAPLPPEYLTTEKIGAGWVLETHQPGLAASVAVLCGAAGVFPLPAWRQRLSDDGRFRYLGGEYPLPKSLNARAQDLAVAAIEALGGARGYLGVDLVLGEADDGTADAVIEVNPRLTTSYVGLRRAARFNLAAAMYAVALGEPPPAMSFDGQAIRFQIADFRLQI
jgi:hypothetical protein